MWAYQYCLIYLDILLDIKYLGVCLLKQNVNKCAFASVINM